MSKRLKRTTKFLLLTLCIALLVINTLVLAPEVGAARGADKTETEINILNNKTDSVQEQLALSRAITIDAAKKEAVEAVEKQLSIIAEEQKKAEETDGPTEAPAKESSSQSSYDETDADEAESDGSSSDSGSGYIVGPSSGGGYLMDIANPDPNYTPYAIVLSDYDRDKVERVIMRECGHCGFTAMALTAQCMRDAFIRCGTTSADYIISTYGYQGSLSMTPSSTCKEVVNFIFDQGGAAVQHRILFYYASDYCSSEWHESQNFIVAYEYERFFDAWD